MRDGMTARRFILRRRRAGVNLVDIGAYPGLRREAPERAIAAGRLGPKGPLLRFCLRLRSRLGLRVDRCRERVVALVDVQASDDGLAALGEVARDPVAHDRVRVGLGRGQQLRLFKRRQHLRGHLVGRPALGAAEECDCPGLVDQLQVRGACARTESPACGRFRDARRERTRSPRSSS